MENKKPYITGVTFWEKDNFIEYSDTDASMDYFHSYNLGTKHLIEWINRDNKEGYTAGKIKVDFGNNEVKEKYLKRLKRICRECGYSYEIKKENRISPFGDKWVYVYAIMKLDKLEK